MPSDLTRRARVGHALVGPRVDRVGPLVHEHLRARPALRSRRREQSAQSRPTRPAACQRHADGRSRLTTSASGTNDRAAEVRASRPFHCYFTSF
jgi:hypothetical protein